MTEEEYKNLFDEYFSKHVATLEQHGPFQLLKWEEPNTWNSRMEFWLKDGELCVTGDLGQSVYRFWKDLVDLRKLGVNKQGGICFVYFDSKISTYHYCNETIVDVRKKLAWVGLKSALAAMEVK